MSISNYLENKILDHALGVAAYSMPSTVYVSLHSANPTDTGSGAELSGNAYARVAATFAAAASGATANSAEIQFPIATPSTWTTATHFGIWDAVSGGNLLWYGALGSSVTVTAGQRATFAVGDLDITLD
jgi:hypothetical protein